jgi:tetratricopeptide (TPR) repeat protein
LLSAAWYALAYYNFTASDYSLALDYLARVIDWDYRYGNNSGLGHAYWLQGQVEQRQNQGDRGLASLRKAEIIFGAISDEAALEAVTNEIIHLKGDKP